VSTAEGGASSRAVDGIMEMHYAAGSCTHTAEHTGVAWWQVDLGDEYTVRTSPA
jgi:hypothetical protein